MNVKTLSVSQILTFHLSSFYMGAYHTKAFLKRTFNYIFGSNLYAIILANKLFSLGSNVIFRQKEGNAMILKVQCRSGDMSKNSRYVNV